jgi:hypothetical protein
MVRPSPVCKGWASVDPEPPFVEGDLPTRYKDRVKVKDKCDEAMFKVKRTRSNIERQILIFAQNLFYT